MLRGGLLQRVLIPVGAHGVLQELGRLNFGVLLVSLVFERAVLCQEHLRGLKIAGVGVVREGLLQVLQKVRGHLNYFGNE